MKTVNERNVLRELGYRLEMFRSTQLRLNSLHDRLETINHIVSLATMPPKNTSSPWCLPVGSIQGLDKSSFTDLSIT
jgi:hypothetical protein